MQFNAEGRAALVLWARATRYGGSISLGKPSSLMDGELHISDAALFTHEPIGPEESDMGLDKTEARMAKHRSFNSSRRV